MIEYDNGSLLIGSFLTFTFGVIVLFVGKRINDAVGFLREFSIPEPVTGGLLFSLISLGVFAIGGVSIGFDMAARDLLLVYFFTTIGINASLKDLFSGGRPLVILLAITIGYMVLQNVIGVSVARAFDQPSAVGMLGGTVSLIGGHGTAIAWAPTISEEYGVANAGEIGIACATFGLILASLMGGPIAKFLIARNKLTPGSAEPPDVGTSSTEKVAPPITAYQLLDAILAIHVCVVLGLGLNALIARLGLDLPLFVTCLFAGILVTNVLPRWPRLTGMSWPTRTPSMAIIADISLGAFLAMSLMSMQLWTLAEMAGPIVAILAVQFIAAIGVNLFIVFPALGRTYDAAVASAGFGGISLGSTPTAMANMAAVTTRYGASHMAFVIVPLVCAFFIDLVNAFLIPVFLANT